MIAMVLLAVKFFLVKKKMGSAKKNFIVKRNAFGINNHYQMEIRVIRRIAKLQRIRTNNHKRPRDVSRQTTAFSAAETLACS